MKRLSFILTLALVLGTTLPAWAAGSAVGRWNTIDYVNGTGMYTDRERHPFPRVMILDLNLPRKRGLDVLREVRGQARLDTMPIVVLTASSSIYDMRNAYDAGANSFLVKPGDLQQLNESVRLLADYWLRANRVPSL